jgi:hypothetical protein
MQRHLGLNFKWIIIQGLTFTKCLMIIIWLGNRAGMIESWDFPKVSLVLKFIILAYDPLFPVRLSLILCYQPIQNGTGSTVTETSRSRPVGCLNFRSCLIQRKGICSWMRWNKTNFGLDQKFEFKKSFELFSQTLVRVIK